MTQAILRTSVDTFAHQLNPDRVYGLHPYIALRGESETGQRVRAYVWFPRPFPKGATVISATLHMFAYNSWPAEVHTIGIRRITSAWIESGVGALTWNNQPDFDLGELVNFVSADSGIVPGYEFEMDVTDLLQTAAATGVFHGLRFFVDTTNTPAKLWHSSESADARFRPYLEIEWAVAPGKPTDLRPSGERSVSLAQPVLSWSFVGEEQSAFQVQISQNSDMTSPVYDPGYITSVDEAHDLDGTAFSATDGQVYYWRVRAKDNHGLESPWSDIVAFRRDTKGTLTITSPTEDEAIGDITPTITHTFTGRTQESVRYVLYRSAGGTLTRIYDSGIVATALTAHTIPDGIITDEGPYRLLLRVYDTLDREATPGDPRYVEAVRNFTFDCDGLHAPTTDLVVADGTGLEAPAVVLTWQRGADPDFWAIKLDGQIILSDIDPADTALGGGDHKLLLWTIPGLVEHTYEVVALENDAGVMRHSCGNAEVAFTANPKGIWFVAPDFDLRCVLLGEEEQEWSLGESGATFTPVGRRDPVRIIDSVRGYEGRVSGTLLDYLDVSAEAWRAALEELRGLPLDAGIRLIIGGYNFGVEILELTVPPRSTEGYNTTVGFIQTRDFTFALRR